MEAIQFNLYAVISAFGLLQGLILAMIFTFNKAFHRRSNYFLIILLLTFSMFNLLGVFDELQLFLKYSTLRFLPVYWYLLIPPAIYFFVRFLTNPNYQIKPKEYLLFVPFLLDITFQISELVRYKMGYINIATDLPAHYTIVYFFEILGSTYTLIITLIVLRILHRYEQNLLENFSEVSDKSLKWLRNLLVGGIVVIFIWMRAPFYFFMSEVSEGQGRLILIGLSIIIYWIGYMMLLQKEWFLNEELLLTHTPESETSKLSDKTEEHYQKLLDIMETQRLYHNPNLNMSILAASVGLSKGYLSQIINQKEGKNFFEFVNAYRVEEIKQKIKDEKFDHYSILGIALEAGFKSKSTFNAVFKKMVGKTPTQFKKDKDPT